MVRGRFFLRVAAVLATVAALASLARAREGAPVAAPVSPPVPAQVERDEQTVYVPYEELDEVFGAERRAVLLPYDDFLRLWGKIALEPDEPDQAPPVEATVSSARYEGRVVGDVAIFEAHLVLAGLKKGWSRVALPFEQVSIVGASVGGKTPLLTRGAAGFEVILPGKGDYTLDLTLVAAVRGEAGEREIRFGIPAVPVSEFLLELPGGPVETETDSAVATTVEGGKVRVLVGASTTFQLRWTPRAREVEGAPAVLFAHTGTVVTAGETFVRTRSAIDYTILQNEVTTLALDIPGDANLLDLEGANVRTWKVRAESGRKRVEVALFEPARKSFHLVVEIERASARGAAGAVPVPFVELTGVERERGWIALRKDRALKIVPEGIEHLSQIGLEELPADLAGAGAAEAGKSDDPAASQGGIVAAWRFLNHPFALRVAVTRLAPEVEVTLTTVARIDEEELQLTYRVGYRVQHAGIFRDRYALPAGVDVTSVESPVGVEDWRVVDGADGARVLEVELAGMLLGDGSVTVAARLARASLEAPVEVPVLGVTAKREVGYLGVYSAERFKIHTTAADGLVPVPAAEVVAKAQPAPGVAPTIAFRYAKRPVRLALGVELRKTKLTASVRTRLDVDEDLVKARATIRYSILYAPVTALSFRVPTGISKDLVVEGAGIKEKAPAGEADGFTTWHVQLQSPTLGDYDLVLTYDQRLATAEDEDHAAQRGEAVRAARIAKLARVEARDVEREQGFVAVAKSANLEVGTDVEALEPIDPTELPSEVRDAAVFLAFKYVQPPWSFDLRVTRHELAAVLDTIVNRASLDTVISDERVATSDLVLEVQNNQRQYLEVALPEGSQVYALFVNGHAERPSLRKSDGVTLLPLGLAGEQLAPFPVRLVFETRYPHHFWNGVVGRIALEPFQLAGVPLQRFEWNVWVPADAEYFEPGGDLSPAGSRGRTGWEAIKGGLGKLTPELGQPGYPGRGIAEDAEGRGFAERSRTEGGGDALPVKLVREGRAFSFARLADTGRVTFSYLGRRTKSAVDLLCFAIPVVVGLELHRRRRLERRVFVVAVGAASLVVMAFTAGLARDLVTSVLWAAVVLALVHWRGALRDGFVRADAALDGWIARRGAARAARRAEIAERFALRVPARRGDGGAATEGTPSSTGATLDPSDTDPKAG